MEFAKSLIKNPLMQSNLAASVFVILVIFALRYAIVRFVHSVKWTNETQRLQWLMRIRLATFLALVAGMVIVWSTQLHTLALSAVAIAAAIVLATKELIMCVSGSLVRYMGESYTVGDRVEIGAFRGDVVTYGILTTSLLEVGPGHQKTGRAIVLPNSMLVTAPVVNESVTSGYVLHVCSVPLEATEDWQRAEAILLAAANEVCADFVEPARRTMEQAAERSGLSAPRVEPRVVFQLKAVDEIMLLVRIPVPTSERSRTEQAILRRFLTEFRPPTAGDAADGADDAEEHEGSDA